MVSEHKVQTLGLNVAQLSYGTVNLNKYADVVFFERYTQRIFVSELMKGMDRLEEYVDEESPYTEKNNLQKEPIQE